MKSRDVPRSPIARASAQGAGQLGPARLRSDGAGFARRLIESADADEVPEASLLRIAEGLQLPGEALPDPARAGLHAAALEAPRLLVGLGAVGLVGAIAALWLGLGAERHRPVPDVAVRQAVAVEILPRVVEPGAGREQLDSAAAQPEPRRAEPAARHAAPRAALAAAPVQDLRAELAALEAVQSALSAQRASAALRLLEDYGRRFPKGELLLEAELLRVEVQSALGQPARALGVARRLLGRPDMARYRARLEALERAAEKQSEQLRENPATAAPARAEKVRVQGAKPTPLDMDGQEETR